MRPSYERTNLSQAPGRTCATNRTTTGRTSQLNSRLSVRSILYSLAIILNCQQKSCWSPPPAAPRKPWMAPRYPPLPIPQPSTRPLPPMSIPTSCPDSDYRDDRELPVKIDSRQRWQGVTAGSSAARRDLIFTKHPHRVVFEKRW